MMEQISRQRQVLQQSEIDSGEGTSWKQCRDDMDGEEQEGVDKISFRLRASVDLDAVDPPPP